MTAHGESLNNSRIEFVLFIVLLFFFSQKESWAEESEINSPKVRVRVATESLPLQLDSLGLEVQGIDFQKFQQVAYMKEEAVSIENKNIAGKRIWFVKEGTKIYRNSGHILRIDSRSGRVKIGIHWYVAPIFLSLKNSRYADVIIVLPLEKYLEGVLMGEMPSSWPAEALKAQAVAARTYTLFQLQQREDQVFQLEGNVLDQVYASQVKSDEKIKEILEQTKGLILESAGKYLKAYYHSDCGGETEEPSYVWGTSDLKLGTTKDKYCHFRSINSWSYKILKTDLAIRLRDKFRIQKIEDVKVLSRTPSRRVGLLAMRGGGERLTLTGQEIRQFVGFDKIKSTLFSLTEDETSVTFMGRGNGHGSGLCQWGARALAQNGENFRDILKHYYPMARLKNIDVEDDGSQF